MSRSCGSVDSRTGATCTRPRGHDGPHAGFVGQTSTEARGMAQWPNDRTRRRPGRRLFGFRTTEARMRNR